MDIWMARVGKGIEVAALVTIAWCAFKVAEFVWVSCVMVWLLTMAKMPELARVLGLMLQIQSVYLILLIVGLSALALKKPLREKLRRMLRRRKDAK